MGWQGSAAQSPRFAFDDEPIAAAATVSPGERIVLVGNGMVGHRLCEALTRATNAAAPPRIVVFGEESRAAYDRVHLGEVLRGRDSDSLALASPRWYAERGICLQLGDPVVRIDRDWRVVESAHGLSVHYDRLVIATGAAAVAPAVFGTGARGDYHLIRTLDDVEPLKAELARAKSAAVVGGGLLGIETAGLLRELGLEVTIVEIGDQLMARHIDGAVAGLLAAKLEARGIRVSTGTAVSGIRALASGRRRLLVSPGGGLEVDLIVVASGVRPRDQLAEPAGLARHPHGGFVVNDLLQTSDPRIHAIGDCAVHEGVPCGTLAPGYEMAEALASTLLGQPRSFRPAPPSIRLKLRGAPLLVAGERPRAGGNVLVMSGQGTHRILAMEGRRAIGAVSLGEWREWNRLECAIRDGDPITGRELRRLRRTGELWGAELRGASAPSVEAAPDADEAVVCACNVVTLGRLRSAIAGGCRDARKLAAMTRAATTCGSCFPALERLVADGRSTEEPARTRGSAALPVGQRHRGLVALGVAVAILTVMVAAARPVLDALAPGGLSFWDFFLREPVARQVTGFGLLGLVLITLGLPLRRKLAGRWPGDASRWRVVHAAVGALLIAATVVHTGLRRGHGLNLVLSSSLLALAVCGAALAIGWRAGPQTRAVRAWRSVHVALLGPALGLVAVHVLAVYYY